MAAGVCLGPLDGDVGSCARRWHDATSRADRRRFPRLSTLGSVHRAPHRARAFAKKLNDAPLAIVDKRRSAHNVSEVMNLIGDVKGKVAVLVDDMIDTAGTITNAAKVLRQEGAREVGREGYCRDAGCCWDAGRRQLCGV